MGGERRPRFSERAADRIRRRSGCDPYVIGIERYLPPPDEYLKRIRPYITNPRYYSRYFNALSAELAAGNVAALCRLPFVEKVDEVISYRREREPAVDPAPTKRAIFLCRDDPLIGKYGDSLLQLGMIQSDELLELGYNGSGDVGGIDPVLICVMDSGFDLRHEAFAGLDLLAEYDFVNFDSVTSNEVGDHPDQDEHGTLVLGALAGYSEGNLVGPAWGAQFILAKTEIIDREIEIEEDKWIAGLEWADSIGADIVTSSLGYLAWYDPESFDGETPLCTRAADIAVSHGIVVVNCAGNYGYFSLVAPADGDSVIAVGAVDYYGDIAYFSSRGPTWDGRIKPDLVAPGVGVHTVMHRSINKYSNRNGTSFSAPLVAGLCAQLLDIDPGRTPIGLRDTLTSTASRAASPDNDYGYGLPRGLAASGLERPIYADSGSFSRCYPNPFIESIRCDIFFPQLERISVNLYDASGNLVRTLVDDRTVKWGSQLIWDGRNNNGNEVSSGVYFLHILSTGGRRTEKIVRIR